VVTEETIGTVYGIGVTVGDLDGVPVVIPR
jgi:hypothetical protein